MGWTVQQEHRLVQLYKQEQADIDGTGSTVDANRRRRLAWQKIAVTINIEFGADYGLEVVKKKFWNIKANLRSKQTTNNMSQHTTGGGVGTELQFTAAEELLHSILGSTKGFKGEEHYIESVTQSQLATTSSLRDKSGDQSMATRNRSSSSSSKEESGDQRTTVREGPRSFSGEERGDRSSSSSFSATAQEREVSYSQMDIHSTAEASGDSAGKRKSIEQVEENA
jgi:hypothetical protein